ncbi:hypothetical protein BBO99_00006619 [Phytophthora kernoviae]|uniref:Kinesin-like protein n=2 Tax=Phytophthora kernoviae TaxID=325452 RepID=A0A3R7H694_9STRA|nr:hypothetical protein G195_007510 [Phytophthora kernoviae 00238/432]KAG2520368.1 hypothetical protein JM16_006712 [Phytophthora kernoviae]KAG2521358.1 hypothetical protein JM18_006558 [Phytophthora kernoviae]RLN26291.1 hypothetical protein BBI17_006643 [Phytophthora kernoviae]RLN77623.1 hypothetical protein BBO99_00006619 [Phytophthora kernoviae]
MPSAPSREDVARAIHERNINESTRPSNTPSLTAEEVSTIIRKLSFSGVAMDEHEEQEQETKTKTETKSNSHLVNKVQIVIRLRPPLGDAEPEKEKETEEITPCFRVLSDATLLAQPPKTSAAYRSTGTATSFHFSRIFRQETEQTELFQATTRPVLDAAFGGMSGLVFAYGVTNSGKTYTISGTEDAPGVLPQSLQYVMDELPKRKEKDVQLVTRVTATYIEIYNENVYDLLSPALRKRRALRVQDCEGKIQVRGTVEKPIKTLEEGLELLEMGRRHKQMAETNYNSDSSRSHCVFTLHFYQQVTRFNAELRSKVSIVDLAGSERGSKSGATGLRMQEASKINGSLMNLMRCLETLRWNQQHPPNLQKMVPFRESKLARLFQENLVGNDHGPLVMIVAVNPSSHEFDETLRTLKYSAVARELAKLELENEELCEQLAQVQAEKMQMEIRVRAEIGNEMREQLQQIRAQYQSMQRQQREDLPSARKKRERQHTEESDKLRAHVQELREKVRECEDEIQRIHKRHQSELNRLQPKLVEEPVG